MTTQNGNLANETEFNTSFMSREEDTSTVGKIAAQAPNSTSMTDMQDLINALRTWVGQILVTNTEGDTPDWLAADPNANIVGDPADDMIDKLVAVILLFLGTGGHSHDGTDGNGPKIDLVGAVNGILEVQNGGTGLNATGAANGSVLIGNGSNFTLATITGTANQVIVTSGAGSITLSLPQDIHTGATPSFAQVILGGDPTAALETATKQYVDNLIQGLKWKENVRAATTDPGTLASDFENGDTIDGVVLATGDRILIKNQASGDENGIYIVQASGAPVRSDDANTFEELNSAAVFASEGTDNSDKGFQQTAELTSLADPQTWVQSFGTGLYQVDGNALQELTTRVFSLVIDGATLTQSGAGLKVADNFFMKLADTETVTGDKTFSGILKADGSLCLGATVDSASTGSNVILPDPGKPIVEVTNAGLVSVAGLHASAPTDSCLQLVVNRTGNTINLEHDNGTPDTVGFSLPGGVDLEVAPNLTAFFAYSVAAGRWVLVGGSAGSGSGGGLPVRNTFNGTTISAGSEARQVWVYNGLSAATLTSIDTLNLDDQAEIELTCLSNDNSLTIVHNDASEGFVLNGDCELGQYEKLVLRWDVAADRFLEVNRR